MTGHNRPECLERDCEFCDEADCHDRQEVSSSGSDPCLIHPESEGQAVLEGVVPECCREHCLMKARVERMERMWSDLERGIRDAIRGAS